MNCSTALAHDIHEQILVHKRSLFLVGHTFGAGYIIDDEVRSAFLPTITTATRGEDLAMASFTPIFNSLTEADIDRLEKEREKDSKRKKRATRGRRGVILPDREPIKTQRSLLFNGVDPTGALIHQPTIEISAPATSSRRAAAIAAQANINLIAQDLPIPDPPSPVSHPIRRKFPGRGRGGSRHSPSYGREGSESVGYNGSFTGSETPTGMQAGFRRNLRETFESEMFSPASGHRRRPGRIADSPEEEDERANGTEGQVKMENDGGVKRKLDDADSQQPYAKREVMTRWHCVNCGVSEAFAGGIKRDPKGERSLCSLCGKFRLNWPRIH